MTYRDDDAVDVNTIDDNDIRVIFPDGSIHRARLLRVDQSGPGKVRVAHYRFPAPGGSWDAADTGSYVIRLRGRQVADTRGRFSQARILGEVRAVIPAIVMTIQSSLPRAHRRLIDSLELPPDPA